ncbi:MAG: outer membrane lipoprotein-sorting protein [Bacteroidota bacterium]|nr:outer membrane lipoprotein-sorting protein [Bacteroidota bacterium]
MKNLKITALLLLLAMISTGISAQNLTGQKIIENVYYRSTGDDGTSELSMHLIDSRNNERVRKIKQFSKDYGKEEKSIMFFLSPADVKNTSFMNWSYDDPNKDDDQWIYLPALKKVKRISSDSKDDYFMGSDFTYDDLGDRHPDEDVHKLLREETIDGKQCYVVESVSKDKDYMYSKTITWVIKDIWIGLKKEFYDEDGDLLKILTVKKYEKIKDYWVITSTEMHNVQDDHTTKMQLSNVQVDIGVDDMKFTERTMMRGL